MINWINSWRTGNKKEVYEILFRLGMITVFQLQVKWGNTKNLRIMILNFGFEI